MSATDDTTGDEVTATGPDDRAAPRIRVLRGGTPSPQEVAALSVALSSTVAPAADDVAQPTDWQRAALLEGIGTRRIPERAQLGGQGPAAARNHRAP